MRYKRLGHSGLLVSELALGTMTFGEDWGWGASAEESRWMFDEYANAGGNLIDTAVNYTNGTAEKFVGDFVAADRDHFVIATKYGLNTRPGDPNRGGNGRKNMVQSLETSLKRLHTDHVDVYFVHMWDRMTPIEETLRALDDMVSAGKVLYIGLSDTPGWVVSRAQTIAEMRGWTTISTLQVPYALNWRDVEREILPVAQNYDMAVMVWGIIGSGLLTGKFNRGAEGPSRQDRGSLSPQQLALAEAVIKVADTVGHSPAQVAINWVRQQQARTEIIPILGARNAAQLRDNLGCLDFQLSDDQLRALDEASPIQLGFPHDFGGYQYVFGDTLQQIDNHRAW